MDKPAFDPSQPFQAVDKPAFDPNQPFQAAPSTPDKYQQAALDEQAALKAKGIDEGAGLTRRLAHGATLGADSTLLAGALAPFEAIKRGVGLGEGYNYAKAREDQIINDARQNTGALGTAAEVLGGGVAGGGLANGGITAARMLGPNAGILGRTAASALDASALGGFSGAMEGNGSDRLTNALKGAALGGALGAGVPLAATVAGGVAAPILSNLRARINPEGYATSQVARAISESGMTPGQIGQDIANANTAGLPYTLADALGNPGQRMLSTVARAPGEGRTNAVNFLEGRQAGQGQRVGDVLDEALGAGPTARQTSAQLMKQAQQESAPLYQEALAQKPVWNERLQDFFNDPITQQGLRHGVAVQRLESLAAGTKFNPNDYAITGFNEAGDPIMSAVPNMRTINLIKKGWDNILEGYRDKTTGKLVLDEYGRALDNVRRSFLNQVDSVNPAYAQARKLYAGPAQIKDAVNFGQRAAGRGRAADNLDQFNSLPGPSQQGFRQGYADTLAGKVENGAPGVNKVRPLTSDKASQELQALSLHQGPTQPGQLDPLSKRLAWEQRMFETRNQALGNSKTAENLADSDAMSVDPNLVKSIVTGDWGGALKHALRSGSNALTGNTAAVREQIGKILLQRGTNPNQISKMVGDAVKRIQFVQNLARNVGRGAAGGLAVAAQGPSVTQPVQ